MTLPVQIRRQNGYSEISNGENRLTKFPAKERGIHRGRNFDGSGMIKFDARGREKIMRASADRRGARERGLLGLAMTARDHAEKFGYAYMVKRIGPLQSRIWSHRDSCAAVLLGGCRGVRPMPLFQTRVTFVRCKKPQLTPTARAVLKWISPRLTKCE